MRAHLLRNSGRASSLTEKYEANRSTADLTRCQLNDGSDREQVRRLVHVRQVAVRLVGASRLLPPRSGLEELELASPRSKRQQAINKPKSAKKANRDVYHHCLSTAKRLSGQKH